MIRDITSDCQKLLDAYKLGAMKDNTTQQQNKNFSSFMLTFLIAAARPRVRVTPRL
jgi:hypothetical protein